MSKSIGIFAQELAALLPEMFIDVYDDGPITIEDPIVAYKTFRQVSHSRLKDMCAKYPALQKSWEAFIIDYNVCLSNEIDEDNDIPF
jgi:hypothetical protein